MEVYQFQLDCENHFLHEHPLGTDEWHISRILRLRKGSCVRKVSSTATSQGTSSQLSTETISCSLPSKRI